jgi:tetratricopeptide (TPR) repeat protein
MRRILLEGFFVLFIALLPGYLSAQDTMAQADALYEQGGLDNLLKSAELYSQALVADPTSYDAAWKASRSYREYCNQSKENNVDGWQEICKQYGKMGMMHGEKAVALNPNKVEGNFWYGCSVGNYSDGVSILTALREGLKDKTQTSFEKSYEIDKTYTDGGPIKALGRFWFVLPWPMSDKDKALSYLKEYNQAYPEDSEGQVFLAEALIDAGGDENIAQAKTLLAQASVCEEKYFSEWAKRLMADL